MATRRDQLQSYQFLLQRVVSALVYRTTDPANSPFRKAGGAVFAGVMLSILALTVTAVIQFFTGMSKNTAWYDGGSIIMEEETGATYVVFPSDDQLEGLRTKLGKDAPEQLLYPVTNFASAALLVGTTEVIEVSQESLTADSMSDEIPARGQMIGIEGLPDSIPKADTLLGAGWSVCSIPAESSDEEPTSLLMVGEKAEGSAIPNMRDYTQQGQAVLVQDTTSEKTYLVWNGFKHVLDQPAQGITALGMTTGSVLPLAPAVIKAIPTGDPVVAPDVNGVGEEPSGVDGAVVGQTYRSGDNFHVVLRDGVAPVSELQAALLEQETAMSAIEGQQGLQAFNADDKYKHQFLPDPRDTDAVAHALPFRIPGAATVDQNSASCINFPSANEPTVFVGGVDVPDKLGVRTPKFTPNGKRLADRIAVVHGRAMLVQLGDGAGAIALLTSDGYLFPFSRIDAGQETAVQLAVGGVDGLTTFGYGEVKPVVLPIEIEALIPIGPELNPGKVAETTVVGSYFNPGGTDGE